MSIQSNVNQGLSMLSLLATQTPRAEKRRVEQKVAAEAPARAAALEMKEKEARISEASQRTKTEERLAAEARAKEAEKKGQIATLTGTHQAHAQLVGALTRTKKGELSHAAGDVKMYEGHISNRETAIASAKALQAVAPTEELAKNIGIWEHDITELKGAMKEEDAKKRKTTAPKAAAKDKKIKESKESVKQAQEAEQARLAESNQIRKTILEIGGIH